MTDRTFAERDDQTEDPEVRDADLHEDDEDDHALDADRAAEADRDVVLDSDESDVPEQRQSDDAAGFGGGAFGSARTDVTDGAARTPIAMGTTAGAAAGGSTDQRFFQDSVTEKLRDRWQSVQIDFVDDPRSAVEQAESLVEQVSTQLTEALAARRRELHGSWSKDGGTASAAHDDGVPTEDLRTALQAYRQVFNQLLAL